MKYTDDTPTKEDSSIEERIKMIEKKLNILNKKFNDILNQQPTISDSPKEPESTTDSSPVEYEDEWYTNHGHGD
jgi:hypothetical protein